MNSLQCAALRGGGRQVGLNIYLKKEICTSRRLQSLENVKYDTRGMHTVIYQVLWTGNRETVLSF